MARKRSSRLGAVGEAAYAVSKECEAHFWRSIQGEASTLSEAMRLLKGTWNAQATPEVKVRGGDAVDRVTEEQFVAGVCALEFAGRLRASFAEGGGARSPSRA